MSSFLFNLNNGNFLRLPGVERPELLAEWAGSAHLLPG